MRKVTILFTALLATAIQGQTTPTELYSSKDYEALIKFEEKAESLTAEELCMVGYAFYQLENDAKAVQFYDKAIAKGFDNSPTHFYKSISLTYLKKYEAAVKEIDIALVKEPNNQEYMNQKGLIYKSKGDEEKALDYFDAAARFPNTYGEPYFWIAYIYHGKNDLERALRQYYIALEKIPQQNRYYVSTLQSIGQLEYTYTQNYQKSVKAYEEAVALKPKDYLYYPKLIKAYNAAKEYAKAEAVFDVMKTAYRNNELPEQDMKYKIVDIDDYESDKEKLSIYKSLEDAKKVLDVSYKVFVFNHKRDEVERIFTVEKTIQVGNGNKHVLCEVKNGSHLTYPYGWKTDNIPLEELKRAIALILDDKLQKNATAYDGE
ncbi:tetratricopeptide repeat protein [Flavobacterium wongokense]|uniref:tetratricopeptide repeat protein n=1 Tax=Flavobacterium wongokense TaxID=2910674 RepID=UPI001F44E37D|nr:tetratricopeptide repeat protein [Flavobacterium sp. WG47]MCF6131936.1 tetratricopeptide repeat protein [Flavobacterium sp. WG47]